MICSIWSIWYVRHVQQNRCHSEPFLLIDFWREVDFWRESSDQELADDWDIILASYLLLSWAVRLSPVHSVLFAWKIYDARLIHFYLLTDNIWRKILHLSTSYSEYIDLWRFFVIKHSLKDKNELKTIK